MLAGGAHGQWEAAWHVQSDFALHRCRCSCRGGGGRHDMQPQQRSRAHQSRTGIVTESSLRQTDPSSWLCVVCLARRRPFHGDRRLQRKQGGDFIELPCTCPNGGALLWYGGALVWYGGTSKRSGSYAQHCCLSHLVSFVARNCPRQHGTSMRRHHPMHTCKAGTCNRPRQHHLAVHHPGL